jgi:hypothetical protein
MHNQNQIPETAKGSQLKISVLGPRSRIFKLPLFHLWSYCCRNPKIFWICPSFAKISICLSLSLSLSLSQQYWGLNLSHLSGRCFTWTTSPACQNFSTGVSWVLRWGVFVPSPRSWGCDIPWLPVMNCSPWAVLELMCHWGYLKLSFETPVVGNGWLSILNFLAEAKEMDHKVIPTMGLWLWWPVLVFGDTDFSYRASHRMEWAWDWWLNIGAPFGTCQLYHPGQSHTTSCSHWTEDVLNFTWEKTCSVCLCENGLYQST